MSERRLTPGSGWNPVGGAVYEHTSGLCCHTLGLCRLPSGKLVDGMVWPECRLVSWFIRVNGGNRKRGVMAWAKGIQIGREQ